MHPEYEVYDFSKTPRTYEAVYVFDDTLLVKVFVAEYDAARRIKGGKPLYKWTASAIAWAPGQGDEDYIELCRLRRDEITARDVLPHEATEDTWLTAVRMDAEKLIERARAFTKVLLAGADTSKRKRVAR